MAATIKYFVFLSDDGKRDKKGEDFRSPSPRTEAEEDKKCNGKGMSSKH